MRILALIQGQYGERIVTHLSSLLPAGWLLDRVSCPAALPAVIDEVDEFLPGDIPQTDILLALTESMSAAQLVTAFARSSRATSVIMPIDNPAWLLTGMKLQLRRELAAIEVKSVFPKTFCTLTDSGCGFRRGYEAFQDENIARFAASFGKPQLEVDLDPAGSRITRIVVKRGAPCGSTHFAAERLVGMAAEEVLPQAGLIVHYHPCMASMQREQLDEGMFEPVMNISGYVMNEELERAINACPR